MSGILVSGRIRYLRTSAIVTLILSVIEILLISGYAVYAEALPSNFLVYLKMLFVLSDFFLAITVLNLIQQFYPPKELSIRIQYRFLILTYLSVFGIVIYLSWLYEFVDMLFFVEPIIKGIEMSEDLLLVSVFLILILFKLVSLIFTQIDGFKLIKEIRRNYRESLSSTSDLL